MGNNRRRNRRRHPVLVALWNRKLGREISERKKAEDELAEKEAQLRTALDNMTDGIYVLDRDLNYVLYNNHYQKIVRLPDGVIKPGAPVSDAIKAHAERGDYGPGDIDGIVRKRVENLASGESVQAELRISNGPSLDLRKAPIAGGGAVVISTDVTERKKAEEELIAAKNLAESATRAKDTFLATMSHEIRTPMNGVVGMIDLLRQTKLDDDQRQMMTTVRDSAYALLTIINDILDFSKIEAGKLDLEQIPVSIRDVIEGVGETLAPNSRAKGVRLLTFVDPNIPDAVLGDQVRIRQILFNIAGNAVKFTEEGKVTVRADLADSGDDKSATVRFQVIDTGIGIPEEAQKDLFKEFSQAEASTTRCPSSKSLGRLSLFCNGGSGSPWIDVRPLFVDGSSGVSGSSVF